MLSKRITPPNPVYTTSVTPVDVQRKTTSVTYILVSIYNNGISVSVNARGLAIIDASVCRCVSCYSLKRYPSLFFSFLFYLNFFLWLFLCLLSILRNWNNPFHVPLLSRHHDHQLHHYNTAVALCVLSNHLVVFMLIQMNTSVNIVETALDPVVLRCVALLFISIFPFCHSLMNSKYFSCVYENDKLVTSIHTQLTRLIFPHKF